MVEHPLAQTLVAARRLRSEPDIRLEAPGSGESLDALAQDPERIAELAHGFADVLGCDEPFVGATLVFERLVAALAMALVYPYYVGGRVPLAEAAEIAVDFGNTCEPVGVTLQAGRFACLAEDPAADHADAVAVGDTAALVTVLHERLTIVAEPLIRGFARPAKRGLRTQWRCTADMITNAAWLAGKDAGDEATGMRLAEALCNGSAPLIGRPGFRTFEFGGATHTHRVRTTCCQIYRLPGARFCVTCPLPKEPARQQRWQELHERWSRQT